MSPRPPSWFGNHLAVTSIMHLRENSRMRQDTMGHALGPEQRQLKAREKSAVKLFATCQLRSVGGR